MYIQYSGVYRLQDFLRRIQVIHSVVQELVLQKFVKVFSLLYQVTHFHRLSKYKFVKL